MQVCIERVLKWVLCDITHSTVQYNCMAQLPYLICKLEDKHAHSSIICQELQLVPSSIT
jgi:hypothetical protein